MFEFFSTIGSWSGELIAEMSKASKQGFVGVGLIFFYFAVMMGGVAYRIKRGEHVSHH